MINEAKLDQIMLELGFSEVLLGTDYLREAVRQYDGGRTQIAMEVYPAVAEKFCSHPVRVERCIRHAIDSAWLRGNLEEQRRCFGWTISPERGKPTVGECIARLARICREN